MLARPSPNHGTLWLQNGDDDDLYTKREIGRMEITGFIITIYILSRKPQLLALTEYSPCLCDRIRLQEGFRFSHANAGIVDMVLEVEMKVCAPFISVSSSIVHGQI